MQSNAIAAAAALVALVGAGAEAQVFQRLIGTQSFETVESIKNTLNGGWVTAGDIAPPQATPRFNVIRYNTDGTINWSTQYGGAEPDFAYSVTPSNDGTFTTAGRRQITFAPLGLSLLRLDAAGNLVWAWTYTGDGAPFDPVNFNNIPSVSVVNVGQSAGIPGYAVATAISVNGPAPNGDLGQLLRVDNAGMQLFNRVYFDVNLGLNTRISFTDLRLDQATNTFVISGTSETTVQPFPGGPFQQRREVLFVRTDLGGNVINAFTYGLPPGPNNQEIAAWGDGIALTTSGDVVIAGHTNAYGPGVAGTIVLRINAGGGLVWAETFKGLSPHFRAVHEAPDRVIGVIGTAALPAGSFGGPLALLTLTPAGAPIFERSYGPVTNPDFGKAGIPLPLPACGWALAGDKTLAGGFGSRDILLARTDQYGRTGCFENRLPAAPDMPQMSIAELPLQSTFLQEQVFWQAPLVHPPTVQFPFCIGPVACPGDANGDGVVNFSDVTFALANFGMVYAPGCLGLGDANGDNIVNFTDVTIILANFGKVCP